MLGISNWLIAMERQVFKNKAMKEIFMKVIERNKFHSFPATEGYSRKSALNCFRDSIFHSVPDQKCKIVKHTVFPSLTR